MAPLSATYRLQLTPSFGFDAARAIVPYLSKLGISDLYLSPIFEARSGSEHGYDVTDPTRIREELGGESGFATLVDETRRRGMGILLDIVPNHLAASHENPWWRNVLTHGRESRFAHFFDIDWERGGGRIVLPILGAPLEEVLSKNEIELDPCPAGGLDLVYFGDRLPIDPRTTGAWDEPVGDLLARQPYLLVHWKEAAARINYRRFFSITELVGVRVEDHEVFTATHSRIRRLIEEGDVTGLRVDHIDGLRDPAEYLTRLRELAGPGVTIIVEKILADTEELPDGWPVDGTTGYDFLGLVNRFLVDPAGFDRLAAHYARATNRSADFDDLAYRKKRQLALSQFGGDVEALALRAEGLREGLAIFDGPGADSREVDPSEMANAILELTACLPVYRTYIREAPVPDRDRAILARTLSDARARSPDLPARAFDLLESILFLEAPGDPLDWTLRWQQLSGAIMAKGVEDTAFYLYSPLISLNEVGCDPDGGGLPAEAFGPRIAARGARWPRTLNATSTHDTKRSEDVRARIAVLAGIPDRWTATLDRWREWNRPLKAVIDGEPAPSERQEVSLYQTLLGAWPLDPGEVPGFRERMREYLPKALREAKVHTSWRRPDEPYERAVIEFADRILSDGDSPFRDDFLALQSEIAFHGVLNSLAQLVLKIASPGTPDFYQGSELWAFHLVDPDNRRPVEYSLRTRIAERLDMTKGPAALADVRASWTDGALKSLVTRRGLAFRRHRPALFLEGGCRNVDTGGRHAAHAFGFLRQHAADQALALVPIRTSRLVPAGRFPVGELWEDTTVDLPGGASDRWIDVLTGREVVARPKPASRAAAGRREIRLAEALRILPVALMEPA